ncbi:MAG: translation initiation factor IF-2 [bacterium]
MTTEKIRVYDIARKLKLPSKEVIDLLDKEMQIKVKSHTSTVDKDEAEKFFNILEKISPNQEKLPEKTKLTETKPDEKSPETLPKRTLAPQYQQIRRENQPFQRTPQNREFPNREFPNKEFPNKEFTGPRKYPPRQDSRNFYPRSPHTIRTIQPGRALDRPPHPERGVSHIENKPKTEMPEKQQHTSRPQIPVRRTVVPREGGGAADLKTPGRREIFNKKKDRFNKEKEGPSKTAKFEQAKGLHDKYKKKKTVKEAPPIKEKITQVLIDKPLTVGELASKLEINISEIIKYLMISGILATVNQVIDESMAKEVCKKLGFTIIDQEAEQDGKKEPEEQPKFIDKSKLAFRAPVVTIMGHVDHGKTTLLDSIRATKHKIVNTEVGGITQSIGAYTVEIDNKKIVFIDTPGHEAFTAMRARGAQATDIAILVVAADDGIMPQTVEAINHAKAAKIPIIVAVNKIDKANADPDKVLQQLTEYDLVSEKWGGDTVTVSVSAIQGTNIDELLEMILLVAELEELKAEHDKNASGIIIEARLDKGKGAVATLLVQSGTLKIGDYVVAGNVGGRVRALISDTGERIKEAGPSTPIEISGLTEVPQAGDKFEVVNDDKSMKTLVIERKEEERTSRLEAITPAQIRKEMILNDSSNKTRDLNIIIKANTHGSAEAVGNALQQLTSKQIFVKIIHVGIGDITEADIMLASASNAIIIGFSVKEDQNILKIAANEGIDIRRYDIIYQIIEDIEKTMLGLLQPDLREVELGTAEIRQVFTIGKTVKIAGCHVLEGKIIRNKLAKIFRNGKEIYKGNIDQLKRFKDDAKEVAAGFECGISFSKFNDIQEGDIIKVSIFEEVERETLV